MEGHAGTEHPVTFDGQIHMVNSYHTQSIQTLGQDFVSIARDNTGGIEAFQHNTRPIYGIVWHPERQVVPVLPAVVRQLLAHEHTAS